MDAAIEAADLRDGAVVSFHHHLRDGDQELNLVMAALARRGLRDLHVAASSVFPVHAPLVGLMREGVVTGLSAGYIAGPVGQAVSAGLLARPARLLTHGGRARLIDTGELRIDAAFIAASMADAEGNLSGQVGSAAFGAMGYPQSDARQAGVVIGVTDALGGIPGPAVGVPGCHVDHVAEVASIGDPQGITSGATRLAVDDTSRAIGAQAAAVIAASGVLQDGFSFQTGAGGISLTAAQTVGAEMARRGVRGGFASGGITAAHVEMLEQGLFAELLDVQCFDLVAVRSLASDKRHRMISAADYAGPHVGGAVVDRLSAVILGAAEVDEAFKVNVTTRADGGIMGGSGGHADTAEGAALTVVTTRLTAAGFAKIVRQVGCITTPGRHVDVVVTEAGIAVNPLRGDLTDRLRQAGLPLVAMGDLRRAAEAQATRPRPPAPQGRIVATGEDRHGRRLAELRAQEVFLGP